jgi:hypothetical protein
VARLLVPKMVKNGFNSVLQTSVGSRRLVATRNSGTMRSPKLSPNHKRRIKTILDQFRNRDCVKTMFVFWEMTSFICIGHVL